MQSVGWQSRTSSRHRSRRCKLSRASGCTCAGYEPRAWAAHIGHESSFLWIGKSAAAANAAALQARSLSVADPGCDAVCCRGVLLPERPSRFKHGCAHCQA
eukprot:7734269-Pyramimonas_sp.AAC.1